MAYFLASYAPLIMSAEGKLAAEQFDIPPYVDYSCRREPDLESPFPSISAICRATNFVPRLNESDVIVYITKKGAYPGCAEKHWRLTAILKVARRFESHEDAATWYEGEGLMLPRNCLVGDIPPLELGHTGCKPAEFNTVEQWDAEYHERVKTTPQFLVCEPLFRCLHAPPVVTGKMMCDAFGRIPGTQNPPKIRRSEYERLIERVGIPADSS